MFSPTYFVGFNHLVMFVMHAVAKIISSLSQDHYGSLNNAI